MGKSEGEAANSIRLSFSPANTIEEAERFLAALTDILERIRDR
jgi:cysteine sulfinate desulfinase/cysteine desulfurase-like protein